MPDKGSLRSLDQAGQFHNEDTATTTSACTASATIYRGFGMNSVISVEGSLAV
jgi:hypothetical protein